MRDMREYVIRPFKGFGPIDFDMTPEQVDEVHEPHLGRGGLPEPSGGIRFVYRSRLQVHFDHSLRCMAIEASVSATSDVVPIYEGIRLRGGLETVLKNLVERGLTPRDDEFRSTFDFPDAGFGLWREDPADRHIASVSVWREDYWRM